MDTTKALFKAIQSDDVKQVAWLLAAGANPNARRLGQPLLHAAIQRGLVKAVHLLLESGADITPGARGKTALDVAVQRDRFQIVELLLAHMRAHPDAGASLCSPAVPAFGPLHNAARKGLLNVAHMLLEHGFSPAQCDEHGRTPLHYAAQNGHDKMAEALLLPDQVDVTDVYGRTPLHDAAEQGHLAVVELLLAQEADVHARTRYGYTALHYAARHAYTAIAHVLVERDAPVNAVVERGGEGGHTPLDYARAAGDAELVACLVARGAEPGREYTPQKYEPLPCPVCAEPRLAYDGSVRWRSGPRPPRSLATRGPLGASPRADYENAHYLHCQNCETKFIDHSDCRDYSIVHVEDGPGRYRYDRPTRRWGSGKR